MGEREGSIQQEHTCGEVQAASSGFRERIGMIGRKA
jgi:hypothetical protein